MANIEKTANAEIINDNAFNIPQGFVCTLDMNTNEGKIAVAKALNGAKPLSKRLDEVFALKGIVTTPGARANTGEECVNNYLIVNDSKGNEEVLFSQSDGVTRSLKVIVALWGEQLKRGETVDVKCIEQELNNGHTLKTVVPA